MFILNWMWNHSILFMKLWFNGVFVAIWWNIANAICVFFEFTHYWILIRGSMKLTTVFRAVCRQTIQLGGRRKGCFCNYWFSYSVTVLQSRQFLWNLCVYYRRRELLNLWLIPSGGISFMSIFRFACVPLKFYYPTSFIQFLLESYL